MTTMTTTTETTLRDILNGLSGQDWDADNLMDALDEEDLDSTDYVADDQGVFKVKGDGFRESVPTWRIKAA